VNLNRKAQIFFCYNYIMISFAEYSGFSEYDNHAQIVEINDAGVGLHGYIAIHRRRGDAPSLGATRLWTYENEASALKDALRLSRLMSFKSALAGLPYGGAKAVLISPPGGIRNRDAFFNSYAKKLNELQGVFVTGNDMGVDLLDIDILKKNTSFVIGQGINSGYFTALGMFYCLEVMFEAIGKGELLKTWSFAIQGLGKTGSAFLELLVAAGVDAITVADIDVKKEQIMKSLFPRIRMVATEQIHRQQVHVLSPCALGGIINSNTINDLRCKAILGSANNQLASPDLYNILHEKGIVYCPDYLVNAGGIISVVDQFEHTVHDEDRIRQQVKKIAITLETILRQSLERNISPQEIADELALQAIGV